MCENKQKGQIGNVKKLTDSISGGVNVVIDFSEVATSLKSRASSIDETYVFFSLKKSNSQDIFTIQSSRTKNKNSISKLMIELTRSESP